MGGHCYSMTEDAWQGGGEAGVPPASKGGTNHIRGEAPWRIGQSVGNMGLAGGRCAHAGRLFFSFEERDKG